MLSGRQEATSCRACIAERERPTGAGPSGSRLRCSGVSPAPPTKRWLRALGSTVSVIGVRPWAETVHAPAKRLPRQYRWYGVGRASASASTLLRPPDCRVRAPGSPSRRPGRRRDSQTIVCEAPGTCSGCLRRGSARISQLVRRAASLEWDLTYPGAVRPGLRAR